MFISRSKAVTYVAVDVAVISTIICAAEFGNTGAAPSPPPARTITILSTRGAIAPDALDRARDNAYRTQQQVIDDANRAGTPWLAPYHLAHCQYAASLGELREDHQAEPLSFPGGCHARGRDPAGRL